VSSQQTSCFAHEQPFSVVNAGQPTSISIEALYTSIGGTPCKHFPSSVVRLYYNQLMLGAEIDPGMDLTPFPSSVLNMTRFEPTTF